MSTKVIRIPEVETKAGIKRSSIYERLDPESKQYDPTFPRPFSLGGRSIGFLESEVDAWIELRAANRRIYRNGVEVPAERERAAA